MGKHLVLAMSLGCLLVALAAKPAMADDLTELKFVVTDASGKPVDRADVVVKFVAGRSIAKLGKKIRKSIGEMRRGRRRRGARNSQGEVLIR